MTNKITWYLMLVAVALIALPALVSCNKDKDKDDDTFTYSTSRQTTLIKAFGLQADADVLSSLDSVHFTVDYDRGLIYNADSLPVGTDITGLKVKIDFLNTVSSAIFSITGATEQSDTTIEYTASMTTELDFTGTTKLTVTSADQQRIKVYDIKVLVHKINPDSLEWPQSWRRNLPGYATDVMEHKVVKFGDAYLAMAYTGDECRLLTATDPGQGTWEQGAVSLPFTPQISTLHATDNALFMLDVDGVLYTSLDAIEWTSCGVQWHSILGVYENRLLGVMGGSDGYYHDEYPRSDDFVPSAIEKGFPVTGASDMIQTEASWAVAPQAMIAGGRDANGTLLNSVWGYDGTCWGRINSTTGGSLPAVTDATLFSYFTYRKLPGVRRYALQVSWYLMGGKLANGDLNGKIYLSNNQGISWTVGDSTVSKASYMPEFYGAQALVSNITHTADVIGLAPRRVSSPMITWDCPYIYLFGGYNAQGELLPNVWRGVYIRLSNTPLY